MLYSMTGFGKCVAEHDNKKITIELKSLNSKQLDISSRVPSVYRGLEGDMRNLIGKTLERGKVELYVSIETPTGSSAQTINVGALEMYKAQIQEASVKLGIPEPADWYQVLMRLPDVITTGAVAEVTEQESATLLDAMQTAVDALMEHRRSEGVKLEAFFAQRIDSIRELLAEVPRYEGERIERIRHRIEESLSKIPLVEYDKGRLEQEMIFYIEKLDINEEKQRLTQHLDYFIATMADPRGQGKKLGFIAQEMGREINTLGSKSNHAEMQIIVVKMKDELEQIKEQVLNVM